MACTKHARSLVAWTQRWWRALLAELLGTALLVGLGTMAMTPIGTSINIERVSLTFGCVLVANVCAFGAVSGAHLNPAVSLAAVLRGELGALPALGYAVAQCSGAALGHGVVLGLTHDMIEKWPVGITRLDDGVSALSAACIEAVLTGMLVLVECSLWAGHNSSRPDPTVPIKRGLVIAGLIFSGAPATDAVLNPARSFGPAVMQNYWDYQWVYWVGPLAGASVAALLHRWVLATRSSLLKSAERDVELPLSDQP